MKQQEIIKAIYDLNEAIFNLSKSLYPEADHVSIFKVGDFTQLSINSDKANKSLHVSYKYDKSEIVEREEMPIDEPVAD